MAIGQLPPLSKLLCCAVLAGCTPRVLGHARPARMPLARLTCSISPLAATLRHAALLCFALAHAPAEPACAAGLL